MFEETVCGVFRRDGELRERFRHLSELHMATLCDVPGAIESILYFSEHRHHLGAGFQIKRLVLEPHAVWIGHRLAGLDAQQDFVRAGVILAEIMRIVRDHQRNAGVGRQPAEHWE